MTDDLKRRASDRGITGRLHNPTVNLSVILTLLLAIISGVIKFTLVSAKTGENEKNITRVERHMGEFHDDLKEIRSDIKKLLARDP